MQKFTHLTRSLLGIGAATFLFLGCQEFIGNEETNTESNAEIKKETIVEVKKVVDESQLELRQSENVDSVLMESFVENAECREYLARIEEARKAGKDLKDLHARYLRSCVKEDPVFPVDSLNCEALRKRIENLDPNSNYYARARLLYFEYCSEGRPRPDSVGTDCESLRKRLSGMDPKSIEFPEIRKRVAEKCSETKPPHDTTVVRPPRDTTVVRPPRDSTVTDCEALRKRMSGYDPDSPEYTRAHTLYGEKCVK